ncbi:MAG: glycoside hydrolase family 9 [Chitinophagia bacterium]|nr:glycoside hydrolase family 9 [Chitinophagia bacterium]
MVRLTAVWLLTALLAGSAAAQDAVLRVNLVGYPPGGPKRALLLSKGQSRERLLLVSEQGVKIRLGMRLSDKAPWPPFTHCYEVDMDTVSTEGRYRIEGTSGLLRSPYFRIGRYGPIQEDVVRFMQSQRCGYNPFIDRVCHPFDGRSFYGRLPDSSYVDARGGWHDAGDQLKYLITGSNATARMLMAWEWYGNAFGDRVNAWGQAGPNGLSDILDEARWGLDWIHRLHPSPDQLIHQVADDRDHRGFKMPDNDSSNYGWGPNSYRAAYFATGRPQGTGRYLSEATGVANVAGRSAAAMAMGHRIWKRLGDAAYSAQCLSDAESLYRMGRQQEGFQQGNSYGAPYRYNERTWADDMEWAAAELYKSTGRMEYLQDAIRYADMVGTDSWMERDSVAHYEMYPYVNIGHHALWEVADTVVRRRLEGYYRHNLERIREKALRNDYGVGHLFVWCSNNFAAAVATQALLYERMSGDRRYRGLLQDHVNWLLGLNPWGSSMITGVPEDGDYPVDVHMPFWRLLGKVVKGSLVDGPLAASIHDRMLQISLSQPDEYAHLQPGHVTYWDDWADYSTNEPTMDGSADLFLILAFLHVGG